MTNLRPLSDIEKSWAANLRSIWDSKKSELRLTQEKAAEKLGFSTQSAVAQYLNGKVAINTDAALKFAKLLGVHPSTIKPELSKYWIDDGAVTPDSPVMLTYEQIAQWSRTGIYPWKAQPCHLEMASLIAAKSEAPIAIVKIESDSMADEYLPSLSHVAISLCESIPENRRGFFLYNQQVVFGEYRSEAGHSKIHFKNWTDREMSSTDKALAVVEFSWREELAE